MRNTGSGKYWENEKPAEIPVTPTFLLKYYPKAGMLQHFNVFDRGPGAGSLSKGVTIDVSRMTVEELNEYEKSVSAIVQLEKQTRAKAGAPPVAATPPAPRRTLEEAAAELGVTI